jgi:hypothetical protein
VLRRDTFAVNAFCRTIASRWFIVPAAAGGGLPSGRACAKSRCCTVVTQPRWVAGA